MGGIGSGRKTLVERSQELCYLTLDPEVKPELVYLPYGNGCSRCNDCFRCNLPDCLCDKSEILRRRVA